MKDYAERQVTIRDHIQQEKLCYISHLNSKIITFKNAETHEIEFCAIKNEGDGNTNFDILLELIISDIENHRIIDLLNHMMTARGVTCEKQRKEIKASFIFDYMAGETCGTTQNILQNKCEKLN